MLRSWLGRQERWLKWRPLDAEPAEEDRCHLSASTVHRWLDGMGRRAQRQVEGQLEGIASSGQFGADGLWARLRAGQKRVVLLLTDSVSGLIWPPVVAAAESVTAWQALFARACKAGLDLGLLSGLTSDDSQGLLSCLAQMRRGVHRQVCIFHLWRRLGPEIARQARQAAKDMGMAAEAVKEEMRKELEGLVHGVLDATSYEQAEAVLARLLAHERGAKLGRIIGEHLDEALMHLLPCHRGLIRVGPEWLWRDFRLRLSRGRNHGSAQRLERAALVWSIYHNFTPAQWRSERKRKYKHPGQSALEVAGASPGRLSYLDALGV